MMTLYQIYSAVDNKDAYADLKQDLIWAFSDKFKELVVSNNLKMEFLPLT